MRRIDFEVPIYKWKITIVTIYNKECKSDVAKLLKEFNLPEKEAILECVEKESFNGGKTFTKRDSRTLVTIIFPWKTEADFANVINHEKRHIIDDILEWHNIQDAEAAAYLDGFVSEEIFNKLNQLK